MDKHYKLWQSREIIDKYLNKNVSDFFDSEIYFIKRVGLRIHSILDIGCACGRLIELFHLYNKEIVYTGMDLSMESVQNARKLYPQSIFVNANALEYSTQKTFDLVNATGVCQHEPQFEKLVQKMTDWSGKYILFDVKLAAIKEHLININVAYSNNESPIYFNILSLNKLISFLKKLENISRISIYGYVTAKNTRNVIPDDIGELVSAGILLEKASSDFVGVPELHIEMPTFLTS